MRDNFSLQPCIAWLVVLAVLGTAGLKAAGAQESPVAAGDEPVSAALEPDSSPRAPQKVEVQPEARDEDIAQRLARILKATGWFTEPAVRVEEGVVFLRGRTERQQYKQWAADLAQNTGDVVAVVNHVTVETPSVWDFRPALAGLRELWRDAMYSLPFFAFGLVILLAACGAAIATARLFQRLLNNRIAVPLLRTVIARTIGILVLLLGLYLVLRVSGLTRLALTVVGGTGLLGLIIGIAFRDITENFLASILLSIQRPFWTKDLVEIEGILGYVQQLNVRTTVLMTVSGNYVQIPNSTVYKSIIRNYTTNPRRREDFTIGIGYDVLIAEAQELALAVLAKHPVVLADPEPWVLVDSLGPATVNLRIYFWLDGEQHSWLKVRSSVIRLIKRAFQDRGITMPDETRELVFPYGVPVRIIQEPQTQETVAESGARWAESGARLSEETDSVSVQGEAGLNSDAQQIEQQAHQARPMEEGENLLQTFDGEAPATNRPE
ncbi:MAG: mechanosensitive ion channel domain-containing protein [Pirellulaceae bacterium]